MSTSTAYSRKRGRDSSSYRPSKRTRRPQRTPYRSRRTTSELKFFDTVKGVTTAANTGTILSNSLNLIPQGADEDERIGRSIVVKKIMVQGTAFLPGTATVADAADSLRLILYYDKQANKAAAAVTDILATASVWSFNNLSNSKRFQILKQKRFAITATAGNGASTSERQIMFQMYVKGDFPIEFNSTLGVIGEITSGNIGILGISQDSKVQVAYTARVRFSDQ